MKTTLKVLGILLLYVAAAVGGALVGAYVANPNPNPAVKEVNAEVLYTGRPATGSVQSLPAIVRIEGSTQAADLPTGAEKGTNIRVWLNNEGKVVTPTVDASSFKIVAFAILGAILFMFLLSLSLMFGENLFEILLIFS